MDFTQLSVITVLLLGTTALLAKNNNPSHRSDDSKKEIARQKKPHDPQIDNLRDPEAKYGKTLLLKQKKTQFRAHGPVQINLAEITGSTKLNGPAEISHSILNTLEHHGSLNCFDTQIHEAQVTGVLILNRSKIFKTLKLEGTLNASDSIIDQITANSAKVVLTNCIVHNLTIIGDIHYPNHRPILELRGSTTVSGTIKFIEADGDVQVYGINTSVNKIENGIISQL